MNAWIQSIKASGLRDTQPRRNVLEALAKSKKPLTVSGLGSTIAKHGHAMNVVTLYRILDAFERTGIVHKHPCDGAFSLCSIPNQKGHHGFLHCRSCGAVEEYCSHDLCHMENAIARSHQFVPESHVSEILGQCRSCRS